MRSITKYYTMCYRCISDRFDIGKATAWRAVRRVVNALYLFLHTFISGQQEKKQNKHGIL